MVVVGCCCCEHDAYYDEAALLHRALGYDGTINVLGGQVGVKIAKSAGERSLKRAKRKKKLVFCVLDGLLWCWLYIL